MGRHDLKSGGVTLALDKVSGQHHAPYALTPREKLPMLLGWEAWWSADGQFSPSHDFSVGTETFVLLHTFTENGVGL